MTSVPPTVSDAVGARPKSDVASTNQGVGVGPGHDDEGRIRAGIDGRFDPVAHFLRADEFLVRAMAATLRLHLVLELLDARDAGAGASGAGGGAAAFRASATAVLTNFCTEFCRSVTKPPTIFSAGSAIPIAVSKMSAISSLPRSFSSAASDNQSEPSAPLL